MCIDPRGRAAGAPPPPRPIPETAPVRLPDGHNTNDELGPNFTVSASPPWPRARSPLTPAAGQAAPGPPRPDSPERGMPPPRGAHRYSASGSGSRAAQKRADCGRNGPIDRNPLVRQLSPGLTLGAPEPPARRSKLLHDPRETEWERGTCSLFGGHRIHLRNRLTLELTARPARHSAARRRRRPNPAPAAPACGPKCRISLPSLAHPRPRRSGRSSRPSRRLLWLPLLPPPSPSPFSPDRRPRLPSPPRSLRSPSSCRRWCARGRAAGRACARGPVNSPAPAPAADRRPSRRRRGFPSWRRFTLTPPAPEPSSRRRPRSRSS